MKKLDCPAPGVYHDVPFAEYAAWDAVNPSLAKLARESMFAFRYAELNPSDIDTDALALGRAVHTCVLEPDDFPLRYVVWDQGDRRGNKWKDYKEANANKSIIKEDDYNAACAMRDSCRSHPAAKRLFTSPYEVETSLVWDDPSSGVRCKTRFDYLGERLSDLKTIHTLDERTMKNHVCAYGYHVSMAARQQAIHLLTGRLVDAVLLFLCKKAPYECCVRPLAEPAMQRGIEVWHQTLGKIADCRATGIYPGFADEEMPLELPVWAMSADELELTMDGEKI